MSLPFADVTWYVRFEGQSHIELGSICRTFFQKQKNPQIQYYRATVVIIQKNHSLRSFLKIISIKRWPNAQIFDDVFEQYFASDASKVGFHVDFGHYVDPKETAKMCDHMPKANNSPARSVKLTVHRLFSSWLKVLCG